MQGRTRPCRAGPGHEGPDPARFRRVPAGLPACKARRAWQGGDAAAATDPSLSLTCEARRRCRRGDGSLSLTQPPSFARSRPLSLSLPRSACLLASLCFQPPAHPALALPSPLSSPLPPPPRRRAGPCARRRRRRRAFVRRGAHGRDSIAAVGSDGGDARGRRRRAFASGLGDCEARRSWSFMAHEGL